jgi:serine/threonine-protein kinase
MSPEQLRGETVDLRTDVWSLAVVLYEMITGRPPFTLEYEQAIRYSVQNVKQASIDGIPKNVSSELHAILDKALEKQRENRFQGLDEMITRLKAVRDQLVSPIGDQKPAVAVLPFADLSPQHDQEYFCDGLTEELINALAKVGELRVSSRISSFQFKGKAVDATHIGERLSVQTIVEGSVRKSGENLRITAQLVDVSTGYQLWSERFDRKLLDIFTIQEEIAEMIVRTLKIKLLPEQRGTLVKRSTNNLAAYNLYFEGRYYWNKRTSEGLKKAIRLFEQAIEKDPQYALAYTGIADSYSLMDQYGTLPLRESVQLAKAAAMKALELDSQLAEAHTSLAEIEMSYNWNWFAAEQRLKQSIALNPNYATAHHWLANCLSVLGRTEEAFAEIDKALELDPFSLIMIRDKGILFYYARLYDEAIVQANKVLEMDSTFALAHRLLAIVYERKGMYGESIAENRMWGNLTKDDLRTEAALGHVYAVSGKKEDALKVIARLEREISTRKDLTFAIALIYTGVREINWAFEWLQKAYDNRSGALGALKVDPKLDGLRSDPRFGDLLKKMGLDH